MQSSTSGDSGTALGIAVVNPALADVQASGTAINAVFKQAVTGAVATFTPQSTSASAINFSATINWGDGTTSTGTITANGNGGFGITGSHTYASSDDGGDGGYALHDTGVGSGQELFLITVTIQDTSNGDTTDAVGLADVSPAPPSITVTGQTLQATAGTAFSGIVATFTDTSTTGAAGFRVLIAWGDGNVSTGTASSNGSGTYSVSGSHTYAAGGAYTIVVHVVDASGNEAVAMGSAVVADTLSTSSLMIVATSLVESSEYFSDLVIQDYQQLLARTPSSAEVSVWVSSMQQGATDAQVLVGFLSSDEYYQRVGGNNTAWVSALYQTVLQRSPDPSGENSWLQALPSGTPRSAVALGFATSSERASLVVENDYQKLLGRSASAAELSDWVQAYQAGATNEQIVAAFLSSKEFYQKNGSNPHDWLFAAYESTLARQPDQYGLNAWMNIPLAVDRRADIYGLGVVLYGALGGQVPPPPGAGRALRRVNPMVSLGLADILDKCLAVNADHRYADAGLMAADLRLHLADRPLRGVANRSITERWRKWRRRHPEALGRAAVRCVVLVLSFFWLLETVQQYRARYAEAEEALRDGQRQWQRERNCDTASAVLQAGLARIEDLPFTQGIAQQLREQLRLLDTAKTAEKRDGLRRDLHRHIERLRALLGIENVPATALHGLEPTTRELWERRELIHAQLSEGLNSELDHDLADLAISWAEIRVRLAAPDQTNRAHEDGLQILSEAKDLLGLTAPLAQQLNAHARALEQLAQYPQKLPPQTAWERTLLGRGYLWEGRLQLAANELACAVEMEPHNPWANYYSGLCSYQLKHYQDAALSFSVCIGAAPDSAGCYYNRALALTGLGQRDLALRDYDRALALDATLASAWLQRAMLHYENSRHDQALEDLRRALTQGCETSACLLQYGAGSFSAKRSRHGSCLREPRVECRTKARASDTA